MCSNFSYNHDVSRQPQHSQQSQWYSNNVMNQSTTESYQMQTDYGSSISLQRPSLKRRSTSNQATSQKKAKKTPISKIKKEDKSPEELTACDKSRMNTAAKYENMKNEKKKIEQLVQKNGQKLTFFQFFNKPPGMTEFALPRKLQEKVFSSK